MTAKGYYLSFAYNGELLSVLCGECSEQICLYMAMRQVALCQLDAVSRCKETPRAVLALVTGT